MNISYQEPTDPEGPTGVLAVYKKVLIGIRDMRYAEPTTSPSALPKHTVFLKTLVKTHLIDIAMSDAFLDLLSPVSLNQ